MWSFPTKLVSILEWQLRLTQPDLLSSQEAQMVALTGREGANFLCLLAYPILVHQQGWTGSFFHHSWLSFHLD